MTAPAPGAMRARLRTLKDPVVRTTRLVLRLPDPARIPELVRLLDDRTVARWTLHVPFPYRARDARSWLRRAPARRQAGTDATFHIVRRSDDRLVGGIGLHHIDAEASRAELGYWIGRPFRHQGYATEAASAVADLAFRRLGLHRLEARVFPGNAGSEGVLRATAFRLEGRHRESVRKDGAYRDELVFARLAGDRPRDGPSARTRRRSERR